jgi:hypothetical protein
VETLNLKLWNVPSIFYDKNEDQMKIANKLAKTREISLLMGFKVRSFINLYLEEAVI